MVTSIKHNLWWNSQTIIKKLGFRDKKPLWNPLDLKHHPKKLDVVCLEWPQNTTTFLGQPPVPVNPVSPVSLVSSVARIASVSSGLPSPGRIPGVGWVDLHLSGEALQGGRRSTGNESLFFFGEKTWETHTDITHTYIYMDRICIYIYII